MTKYIIRRIALMIPTLLLVSIMVFGLMRMIPGDAATLQIGDDASAARVEALREQLGLNRPAYIQYFDWLADVAVLDFGDSLQTHEPVSESLLRAIPVSAQLTAFAFTLSAVVGVTLGLMSSFRRNSPVDYAARIIAILGLSVPAFVLGSMFLFVPAIMFGWFPPAYVPLWEDPLTSTLIFILPALSIGYRSSGVTARMVRSSMLEVLNEDYIRTARAKGVADRQVYMRHALKNAAVPVITIMGSQVGGLLGGALISETIFSLPGVGRMFINAVANRDFPMIQAAVLFMAISVAVMNLLVDLLYTVLDPRIRYS